MKNKEKVILTATQQYNMGRDLDNFQIFSHDIYNSFRKVEKVSYAIINITREMGKNNVDGKLKVFNILNK